MSTNTPPSRPLPALVRGAARLVASFVSSTRGGGMLVACAFAILFLAVVGSAATDYAWREAQWEELESSTRAAVAALGPLLGGQETAEADDTRRRLDDLLVAMQPGFTVDPSVIKSDGNDIVDITVGGRFTTTGVWGGGENTTDSPKRKMRVKFEHQRYEVAVALDITESMSDTIRQRGGGTVRKMDALKEAMEMVVDVMEKVREETRGAMMVSLVPFASAVNVADTTRNAPQSPSSQVAARTEAKERYVRMLAGATRNGQHLTMSDVLLEAKRAADAGEGQWVDTFHRYGVGANMGPLRSQGLPDGVLDDTDWNLRRRDVSIPLAQSFPLSGLRGPKGDQDSAVDPWVVDDRDFWNGCVMARWGAWWAASTRPSATADPADWATWPVETDAPGWSPAAPAVTAPLHISDAPPDAGNAHTLFTAYSWPDSWVSRSWRGPGRPPGSQGISADHYMQIAMSRMLDWGLDGDGEANRVGLYDARRVGMNDWRYQHGGGHANCPQVSLTPLTHRVPRLRAAIQSLDVIEYPNAGRETIPSRQVASTFIVRGVAWALRTLSPLWQNVWQVENPGRPGFRTSDHPSLRRPGIPCTAGQVRACDPLLHKSILLVSDGANATGRFQASRTAPAHQSQPPEWNMGRGGYFGRYDPVCNAQGANFLPKYHAAWAETTPDAFNAHFRGAVSLDANDRFSGSNVIPRDYRAAQAFDMWIKQGDGFVSPRTPWRTPVNHLQLTRDQRLFRYATALSGFTPWEVFRGPHPGEGAEELFLDRLMQPFREFHMDGRPVQTGGYCRPHSAFSPYGGLDDEILVGAVDDGGTTLHLAPVRNEAPFSIGGLDTPKNLYEPRDYGFSDRQGHYGIWNTMSMRLDRWFLKACDFAGERGVRINAIFIGNASSTNLIGILEDCVDKAGGDPNEDEVFVTPTADELKDAFEKVFTVRRNLRFLT